MLTYIRNIYILLLVVLLACPFSLTYANGDFASAEKHKASPLKKCKPYRVKRRHHHRRKKSSPPIEEKFNIPLRRGYTCKESPVIMGYCEGFPIRRVNCKTVNPADIVDFTCNEFSEKIKTCEPYSCQAPYVLDPSTKTVWKILGKNGDRCVVSNTTEDVGIKDRSGNSVPITQTCEYDKIGIKGLVQRFIDLQGRYFHFSTCERYEGIHNCTFRSRGQSIQDAKKASNSDVN